MLTSVCVACALACSPRQEDPGQGHEAEPPGSAVDPLPHRQHRALRSPRHRPFRSRASPLPLSIAPVTGSHVPCRWSRSGTTTSGGTGAAPSSASKGCERAVFVGCVLVCRTVVGACLREAADRHVLVSSDNQTWLNVATSTEVGSDRRQGELRCTGRSCWQLRRCVKVACSWQWNENRALTCKLLFGHQILHQGRRVRHFAR